MAKSESLLVGGEDKVWQYTAAQGNSIALTPAAEVNAPLGRNGKGRGIAT